MQATFPHLAQHQEAQFYMMGQSQEVVESITGAETITPTMRGHWRATVNFVLKGEASTLQWQTFMAQMQGRIGTTLVPVHSRFRPKDRNGRPLPFAETANLSDAQTWEHFGLENTQFNRITLAAAAPLRATQLSLTLFDTTGIRPGQFFSIGERLYRVQSHWQPSAGVRRVMIEPPLRAAAGVGTPLEVARPVCRMRMVSETEGLFDQTMAVRPRVSVNFREAI
ncbi:MAG: hypothetical protein ABNH17_05555 [Paracoccus sp. (in: a-proteobacteria)]|jgi:hypothetical protein|uniref:hypothetical protein n=1 Tax=Paracoccus sp. TaxID=267 RepID=UPI0032D8EEBB